VFAGMVGSMVAMAKSCCAWLLSSSSSCYGLVSTCSCFSVCWRLLASWG